MDFCSTGIAHGLILLISAASMLTASMATRSGWYFGFNYTYTWPWPPKNVSHDLNHTYSFNYTYTWPPAPNSVSHNLNHTYGFNYTYTWPWAPKNVSGNLNHTQNDGPSPSKIVVGGSELWHFGFNYSDWAFQNAPFYVHDVLVFKYDPPSDTVLPQSVYLLPDLWSYLTCDLSRAKMIANVTDGGGEGFEFVLKKLKPYYFASGEGDDGLNCSDGGMKFMVMPLFRPWHY